MNAGNEPVIGVTDTFSQPGVYAVQVRQIDGFCSPELIPVASLVATFFCNLSHDADI